MTNLYKASEFCALEVALGIFDCCVTGDSKFSGVDKYIRKMYDTFGASKCIAVLKRIDRFPVILDECKFKRIMESKDGASVIRRSIRRQLVCYDSCSGYSTYDQDLDKIISTEPADMKLGIVDDILTELLGYTFDWEFAMFSAIENGNR